MFLIFASISMKARSMMTNLGFLLHGAVMRNLSVAPGIAVSAFGAETDLVVTPAFIIQVQGAAWYGRPAPRFRWLEGRGVFKACTEVPGKRGNS